MEEFVYDVIDKNGKERRGNIEAENKERAEDKLRKEGLIPIEIKEAGALNREINLQLGGKVKPRDLSVFCRQFVSMITAGITILDAIEMLSEQTENKKMSAALKEVLTNIKKGETLSSSMQKHPQVFPAIMINMIAAGEASGKLETSFNRMAVQFEKNAKVSAMMKKAAIYPIIVALVAVGVIIVMLVKIIPGYSETFEQLGVELPWVTRAVMGASDTLTTYWYLFIAGLVVIILGLRAYKSTENGKKAFGRMAIKVPVFGKLNVKTASSMFARTLSTLICSGLPMMTALDIVSKTMSNVLYEQLLTKVKEEVAKGVPMSEPILKSGLFPPMVPHMVRIGEETGEVEEMLNRLADYYDEEVEIATQTVMAALEPMIILLLAGIVIVLVAAIMSPMIAMYNNMDKM